MFGYWQLGRLLDGLARGDAPAITGLPDTPFSLALHDEARKRYEESSLRLSPLGEALLRGEDDILRHRPPRFWWGGTLLTPERVWRWDASTGHLGIDAS